MSTSIPGVAFSDRPAAHPHHRIAGLLREPLVHFIALGALLFAIDHWFVSRADDPQTIVVTAAVDNEARELFKARRGRDPRPDEVDALRRVWLDNEVLYREGIAMQLDRGDPAIRDRVIFKALSVVDASVKAPTFDERAVREWFEANRVKYDEPPRYDFQEAVLYGDTSESAVREFTDALNKGTPGDAKAGLRIFKGRPHANIVESYGSDFAGALEEAPPGQWRVYKAGDAWRVMRLESITPSKPAAFESVRSAVLQDWNDAKMADQRTAAVRVLAKKYTVKVENATP